MKLKDHQALVGDVARATDRYRSCVLALTRFKNTLRRWLETTQ